MYTRSSRLNLVLSIAFISAMGACGSAGGCGGCSTAQPLPGGSLPPSQTVEGGAQIRVTPHGFSTLTSLVPGLLASQLSAGFCVPPGSVSIVDYCQETQGTCSPGCKVVPALNSVSITPNPNNNQVLTAHVDARASGVVPLHIVAGTCDVSVTIDHLTADVDVTLGTDPATGALTIHANPITDLAFTGLNHGSSGVICGLVDDIAGLLVDVFQSSLEGFAQDLLSPAIVELIQGFLPDPLGLEGVVDVGSLLSGVVPGVSAKLETRLVPGGYVHMAGGGLSLGVVSGINSDRDPTTRTGALASEPALCVPPLDPPVLARPPTHLVPTPRGSFLLDAARPFDGLPDPPASSDIVMGVSKTLLDLTGHHLVTSGALCLQVGTAEVSQLNVGTIGLLVPSLTALESSQGNDPMLLVTRPQRALGFTIGDNTMASPAITFGFDHLQVDFYAFLFERYVRAFTIDLTMNVGVNVEIEQPPGGVATVQPMLVGISPSNIQLTVSNTEFIRESPDLLEAVLPSVFGLITPLLGELPALTIPSFAGFTLDNPSVQHVTTSQDDFLALYASLKPTPQAAIAAGVPVTAAAIEAVSPPSTGTARLVHVTTPAPELVRAALHHDAGGAMPQVAFDVDAVDAAGRPLEWSYQLEEGMWHTWQPPVAGAPLVIEDMAFAWQGKYTIGLRSRVVGDIHTVSETARFPVIIDSVAPRFVTDQARTAGDRYELPAFDIVSGDALQVAFGPADGTAPRSAWTAGATLAITRDAAASYAGSGGTLAVYARDEAGNTARAVVTPFAELAGTPGAATTAGCNAGGGLGGGALLVIAAGLLALGRRRAWRRRSAMPIVAALWLAGCGGSRSPGSGPSGSPPDGSTGEPDAPSAPVCKVVAECDASACTRGELAFCIEGTCVCSDDVPPGRIGPYSAVAVAADGTVWVSAYAETHGDLVVAKATGGRISSEAWEWVDGVPDGPVAVPGSQIRGGIADPGPDVGLYTSIAVAPDGVPMVSYFDQEAGALKLAQRIDGAWQIHVVDAGPSEQVGMYTSLTLRSDDGRPGIAYLAHVQANGATRAEVRFAAAQSIHPSSAADWVTWVVDSAAVPADPGVFPLPEGTGLFIAAARLPNQVPVVAYYDRGTGDLKLSKLDVQTGQFAAPRILDGTSSDAGWSPSVAVDPSGVVHVAYAGATAHDLRYVSDASGDSPHVVDSGYRIDGTTVDGLPQPVFHFVGADASLVLAPDGARIVYQDATTQELLVAQQHTDGTWTHMSIAGATVPWPGGYGFFAAGAMAKTQLVISTWVVNPPAATVWDRDWVEVFSQPLAPAQ